MIFRDKRRFKKWYDQFILNSEDTVSYDADFIYATNYMVRNFYIPAMKNIEKFDYGEEYEVFESALRFGYFCSLYRAAKEKEH